MKARNFNISGNKPRVLVAPLDWGLGHATRCIPLIRELLDQNCDVILAAERATKLLLENEFPGLQTLCLRGYRIKYPRNPSIFNLTILLQFPKLVRAVLHEHRWLKKAVREYQIDAVISDNRLGLYHSAIPCMYITHQLNIKTGNPITSRMANALHFYFINQYNACWVPDLAAGMTLAGELSHPVKLPKIPLHYMGPLTRFEKVVAEKEYDLLFLLSGPEPQRKIFESLLLRELNGYSGRVLLVRGLPGQQAPQINTHSGIETVYHLPAAALNQALARSALVIGRCGYSTVMDLALLQKKAILVPTPGQAEQGFLARHLMENNLFLCVEQKKFSLKELLLRADTLASPPELYNGKEYRLVIKELLERWL